MEAVDKKILAILQDDADITNAALAERVHLSPSTCLRRVQRLKADGIITKVVAIVEPASIGRDLTAIVNVVLDRHGTEPRRAFTEAIAKEPAITQAYAVTGEIDAVLIMALHDMTEYQDFCDRVLHNDPNVLRFTTNFAMQRTKFVTSAPA